MSQCKSPYNILYFHGKITRDRAEDLLMSQGAIEGMFLLRESVNGNYVISICHCNKVNHYNIEKQLDGTYQILTGRKFIGPIELVEHHMLHLDGFLTLARLPLERYPAGTSYYILQGVKSAVFEDYLKRKAIEMGFKDSNSIDEALNGPMRQHLKHMVLKDLHMTQPWFHHFLRRLEAEERLESAGHTEGQFFVRQRKGDPGFVLSLSYQNQPKHYKIINKFDKLHIEGGQYFDSLIELIDHYHFRQDGLLCKLRFAVECPGYIRSKAEFFQTSNQTGQESNHSTLCGIQNTQRAHRSNVNNDLSRIVTDKYRDMSINSIFRQKKSDMISVSSDLINFSEWSTNLPRLLNEPVSASLNNLNKESLYPSSITTNNVFQWNNNIRSSTQSFINENLQNLEISENKTIDQSLNEPQIIDQLWSEPEINSSRPLFSPTLEDEIPKNRVKSFSMPPKLQPWDLGILDPVLAVETQKIYDSLPLSDVSFNLSIDKIEIKQKLGGGNFGYVYGGFYKVNLIDSIPIAIKMLKKEMHSQVGAQEIMEEARTMAQLRHKHIVRLIGVCKCDQILLILELAPLGPINKYLRRNQSLSVPCLIDLMTQVSKGMAYLEASKFVHRDLAARNVLLVNEKYAKISDFGMSKALNYGQDYYRAAAAGKWPLKWYAPECIYYFRFDSKSDVWSYGITLWEVFSYGERPYKDLKGTQILTMLDNGQRLKKPIHCPDLVYDVMLQCWSVDGVRRPTFAELLLTMSRIQANFSSGIHEIIEQTSYLANSSGSSVAKTSYGSSECSQFPSPPISTKNQDICDW